jgi:serine/threonine-protein phosphatase 2A regulatory subunit B'
MDLKLSELPSLNEAPPLEHTKLFRQKLLLCRVLYDFSDPRKHIREKEAKRTTLMELVQFVSDGKVAWSLQVVEDLIACIEANIFRSLGGGKRGSKFGKEGGGKIEGT